MHREARRLLSNGVRLAAALLAVTAVAAMVHPSDAAPPASNQCVACHTDLKGLIRLCWQVEKIKPRPKASAETAGEG
jgi:hypothetical protein